MQRLRRLIRRRSVRHGEGAFVMEGVTLVAEALTAGAPVEAVFVDSAEAGRRELAELAARAHDAGTRVFELAPGVLERVADTVTPQPILAVVRMPDASIEDLRHATFVVVCVDVRDPGNTGAVIRAADAAGADAVVCADGTADPYNPKTVRASAGSVLHLPILHGLGVADALETLGGYGLRRVGAAAHGGSSHDAVDLASPVAVVLGNEASGLADAAAALLDEQVTIPLSGRAESLNVSLAAAVLCFEVRRQRSNLSAVESPS
ncbi:MAG: TrmH family RNA methyltransferase [Acidimicrobiales bacterium]